MGVFRVEKVVRELQAEGISEKKTQRVVKLRSLLVQGRCSQCSSNNSSWMVREGGAGETLKR